MTKKQLKTLLKNKSKELSKEEQTYLDEELKAFDSQGEWKAILSIVEDGKVFKENNNNILSFWLLDIAPKPTKLKHKYELADMADIDLDFAPAGRDKLKDYLRNKYGEDKCLSIGTYGTLGVKGSVQEVSRVYDIPPKEYLKVSKAVSDDDKDLDEKEIREKYPQVDKFLKKYPQVAETMTKLTGMKKSIGQHAGGFIVSSDSLFENIPVVKSSKNWVSGWQESGAVKELEALGFIKVDILGLAAVEQINQTVKEINRRYPDNELPEDIYNVSVEDQKVYDYINTLELDNVFQMESKVFVGAVQKINPQSLADISNISTLIRPGAACSVDKYASSKLDKTKTPRCLWDVFEFTRGWLIYQEQLMQVLQELGGFDIFKSDKVRRLVRKIGKSKTSDENKQAMLDEAEEYHKIYLKHAIKKIQEEDGWSEKDSEEYAEKQWDALMGQAKYSFNAPHSFAYSLVGYVQAYLKTYYPIEFWVATLNTIDRGEEKHNQSSLGKYIHSISRNGIRVIPPNVNKSGMEFQATNSNEIAFALSYIKNAGKGVDRVIENRPYKDWDDFLNKSIEYKFNKSVVKGLIFAGAADFEDDIEDRPYKWALYLKAKKGEKKNKKLSKEIEEFLENEWPEYFDLIEMEYDYCKYSFTGIDEYLESIRSTHKTEENLIGISERNPDHKLWSLAGYISDISTKKSKKSGNEYVLITVTDFRDSISVFAFGNDYRQKIFEKFKKGMIVKIGVKNDSGWLKLPWEKEYNGKFPIKKLTA